jgi:catechol 2,3-dioxygenase-like lactoylglutathione lyase family enzyme
MTEVAPGKPRLVPELAVSDIGPSVAFWCDILSCRVLYERPEDGFACIERDGVRFLLDQIGGGTPERRDIWTTGPLEKPLGCGINFELVVDDLEADLARITAAGVPLFFGPEERWYRVGDQEAGVKQVLVQDPDGYLIRLQMSIGSRPASGLIR